MSGMKVLKKGEFLFKEGEKIQTVFMVQSGQVNLCVQKNKKNIEIMSVGVGYVFADNVILGLGTYPYSGLVTQEAKVVELPVESFRQQFDSLHQVLKSSIKAMSEKMKWAVNEIKTARLEKSPAPCPEDAIPKVFGAIYHTALHKGLKDNNKVKIDWITLRQYSQRIFGESFKRIEFISQILVKLKYADFAMEKSPDDPDGSEEIQGLIIHHLPSIEAFFEFYQYYYYKGGKADLLKFDEPNYNTLRLLLLAYEGVTADKYGVVTKEFNSVVDFFKDYGVTLGQGHFTALEAKCLFCKRKNADGKVQLQFDLNEFKSQAETWKIIREIDRLNEKGYVDLNDVDQGPKKRIVVVDGVACDQCHFVMIHGSKFCSECGHKLVLTAAPAGAEKKAA